MNKHFLHILHLPVNLFLLFLAWVKSHCAHNNVKNTWVVISRIQKIQALGCTHVAIVCTFMSNTVSAVRMVNQRLPISFRDAPCFSQYTTLDTKPAFFFCLRCRENKCVTMCYACYGTVQYVHTVVYNGLSQMWSALHRYFRYVCCVWVQIR